MTKGYIGKESVEFKASSFHEAHRLACDAIEQWLAKNAGWVLFSGREVRISTSGAVFLVEKVA